MKIIKLEAENYKRLRAVTIEPDITGNLVVISGKNGQGKSSVLDAITAALGGVDSKSTPKPIREGADNARIVLETEDLIVTRKFNHNGGSTLRVVARDGSTFTKGQAKLDTLLGRLSLDPLAFTRMSDKDQRAQLLDLVKLPFDPAELDAERAKAYEERTLVNRAIKNLGELPEVDEDLPTDEVSQSALFDRLTTAQGQAHTIQQETALSNSLLNEMAYTEEKIKALQARLSELVESYDAQEALVKALPQPEDVEAIRTEIAGAEERNTLIRANNHARAKHEEATRLQAKSDAFTAELQRIDKTKTDGLAEADMPVEGLSFDQDGVLFQGVPFKQASTAEQMRVSLAMAIALNPELRVIRMEDASVLDSDSLKIVQDEAEKHDFQVWLEMVDEHGAQGIEIVDGEVA